MIKYCCYYCKKFRNDTCVNPICYNAYAHPNSIKEGQWYCRQYEGGMCGETTTGNGKMAEAHMGCFEASND